MSKSQETHTLAEHIHYSFVGRNGNLTDNEIDNSRVSLTPNSDTEKLNIFGAIDERPAYQSLAKDKDGNYHLSTVFTEYGGEHIQHDFRSGESLKGLDIIGGSLFFKELARIALNRS
jgi:hypothetical protein